MPSHPAIEPRRTRYQRPIELLIRSGRTIDAIWLEVWRMNVGYPEDRDEAKRRLQNATEVLTDD